MSPYVANDPTCAPPSLAPTCTYGWASRPPTASASLWPMSARMNQVPRSSSTDEVDEEVAGRRPALGGDVAERAADQVAVAVERDLADDEAARVEAGVRHAREHVDRRRRARRACRDRRTRRASLPSSAARAPATSPAMTRNMMLRWSSVQLMSIGRVCTCGHTRGARGPLALDGGHHLVARRRARPRCGRAATAWSGCRASRDSSPSISTRDTVRLGVEELVDDLEHAAALAEHRAQRLELGVLGPAARHRAKSSSMST